MHANSFNGYDKFINFYTKQIVKKYYCETKTSSFGEEKKNLSRVLYKKKIIKLYQNSHKLDLNRIHDTKSETTHPFI